MGHQDKISPLFALKFHVESSGIQFEVSSLQVESSTYTILQP